MELLSDDIERTPVSYVAVAFIDVVMETDTAGLELCQFIREKQRNRRHTLYIRTGQPGVAPERSVIDRYDISGYFTKVELTEDKLYSLVKAGARQFDFTNMALGAFEVVTHAIAAGDSLEQLSRVLYGALDQMPLDAAGQPHVRISPTRQRDRWGPGDHGDRLQQGPGAGRTRSAGASACSRSIRKAMATSSRARRSW